jgi:lysophospholipase L1-like esterase
MLLLAVFSVKYPRLTFMAESQIRGCLTAVPPKARQLDYFGDSTVIGALTSNTDSAKPPPSWVSLPGFTVVNRGLRGDSTQWLLDYHTTRDGWAGLLKNSPADTVVINHAINDRNALVSITAYKANLNWIADLALIHKKRLILETPNPIDYTVSGALPISDYAQAMRDVAAARGLAVIDQYAYMTSLIGSQPITGFMPDGVHPNDYTYRLKGEFANKELFRILCA